MGIIAGGVRPQVCGVAPMRCGRYLTAAPVVDKSLKLYYFREEVWEGAAETLRNGENFRTL
jgi:hypothetical protein